MDKGKGRAKTPPPWEKEHRTYLDTCPQEMCEAFFCAATKIHVVAVAKRERAAAKHRATCAAKKSGEPKPPKTRKRVFDGARAKVDEALAKREMTSLWELKGAEIGDIIGCSEGAARAWRTKQGGEPKPVPERVLDGARAKVDEALAKREMTSLWELTGADLADIIGCSESWASVWRRKQGGEPKPVPERVLDGARER